MAKKKPSVPKIGNLAKRGGSTTTGSHVGALATGAMGSHVGAFSPTTVKTLFDQVASASKAGSHVGAYATASHEKLEVRPGKPTNKK